MWGLHRWRARRVTAAEEIVKAAALREEGCAPALDIEVLEERNAPIVWRLAREFQETLGRS
jgi:hypothetical protein